MKTIITILLNAEKLIRNLSFENSFIVIITVFLTPNIISVEKTYKNVFLSVFSHFNWEINFSSNKHTKDFCKFNNCIQKTRFMFAYEIVLNEMKTN